MSPRVLSEEKWDVIIVGAGPVGLFLACCLTSFHIRCLVLERRAERMSHSRSIGIHPPSLELLQRLGLAERAIAQGVKVYSGRAFGHGRPLGTISFASCPKPFSYVLTIPQQETERLLEEQVHMHAPGSVCRGARIARLEHDVDGVSATVRLPDHTRSVSASYLIGCDGHESQVRKFMEVESHGGSYPDLFVMGDFHDKTTIGDEALIYLDDHGFVETFPLPGKLRRWVVHTGLRPMEPSTEVFCQAVSDRTGYDLAGTATGPMGAFGTQRGLASALVRGRVALAGDAAHVMSPIGGQGMNVGWLNAWELACALRDILQSGSDFSQALGAYERHARRRARRAIRRSELYMAIGRAPRFPSLRDALVSTVLHAPFHGITARLFTMRWL